jgi:hypothetical protein
VPTSHQENFRQDDNYAVLCDSSRFCFCAGDRAVHLQRADTRSFGFRWRICPLSEFKFFAGSKQELTATVLADSNGRHGDPGEFFQRLWADSVDTGFGSTRICRKRLSSFFGAVRQVYHMVQAACCITHEVPTLHTRRISTTWLRTHVCSTMRRLSNGVRTVHNGRRSIEVRSIVHCSNAGSSLQRLLPLSGRM